VGPTAGPGAVHLGPGPDPRRGDPQVLANGYLTTLRHPDKGECQVVSTPLKFQRTPGKAQRPAPEVGQHTELTLLELGYTWDEIAVLKEQGAII
jgi:crotonobetainyl-CoA:carnitine CoA-transferase CaiB-like acyl-CoA transferase